MSFDELPPDSEPPKRANAAPRSEQEASVQDAPPSGTPRRRRATRTGTDAASSAPTEESKPPKRRTRSRATESEPSQSGPLSGDPNKPVELEGVAPPEPQQRSTRRAPKTTERAGTAPVRRSTRVKAATDSPGPEVAPAPPAEDAAPKRAPRTRSSVRAKSEPTTEAAAPEQAPPKARASRTRAKREPAPEPEPAPPAAAPDEATPKPRSRSRARRGPKPDTPTEAAAEAAPAEPALAEAAAPSEAPTGRSRSRRGRGRGKRDGAKTERTEPQAVAAGEAEAHAPQPKPVVRRHIDRSVGCHLIMRNGVPQITIDGVTHPPVLFFGNVQASGDKERVLSEVRRAARSGVHLHSTLVELPCPLSEATESLDEIDRAMRAILDTDPQGYVMPRIVFVPARGWKREYPTDIATYADGSTGDPSLTSERFWREAEHSLETLISHLRDYEWSNRIIGYHLERGEWFQPADLGYDRSMANREAFRDWLREKYKNSLVALRAAWYDGNVQFHTAEIPPVHAKPNPQRAFFETRRERRTIDFFAFTSESTASRLAALAAAIKRAADDRALVSVCYGYAFEFGHGFSGHLALGQLLDCPDIDLICGPPSYRDRKPGGAASVPAPIDSPRLHGKLWMSEDDTKTYLAPAQQDPDDFNPRLGDRFQTEQAHARATGRAFATRSGIGFMDLWGEGWLDDDSVWDPIAKFVQEYSAVLGSPPVSRRADVVVLVDEKSLLHIQRGEAFFRKITAGMRDLLQRSGVEHEIYLQSDLLHPDFPVDAKLYLFVDPYRLTAEQRAAIAEKLQRGGKTLAWLYAPGSCEERPQIGGAMEESATGAVGLTLRQQEWNSEIGSRVVDHRHIITERMSAREVGVRERLNPSFYVEDPDATLLAEFHGSGLPSIAVKKCGDWQTVFVGEPTLTWELLRGICKYAGVHLWTGGEDVAFIGNDWVTVHASREGHRAIRLPTPTALYDLTERRLVGDDMREHRFFQKAGTTHTFCLGTIERFRELGLPNLTLPVRPPRQQAPSPADEVQEEAIGPAIETEPVLSEDMQTLRAVLSMDLSEVGDLDFEDGEAEAPVVPPTGPTDPAEAEARLAALLPDAEILPAGRRRRRRGGRGRGRRKPDQADGAVAPESGSANGNRSGDAAPAGTIESDQAAVHSFEPAGDSPDLVRATSGEGPGEGAE